MSATVPRARASRIASAAALAAALLICGIGLVRGTWAAGGSDSSCYALMADAFARGDLQPFDPRAQEAPWPDALLTFAPAGFVPSAVRPGAASPICAPGFSLLLAPFRLLAGPDGIFIATPLTGGLVVWLTYVVARRLAGARAGLGAAVLTATIPVLLFQVVQPMNDVAASALWMAVLGAALTPDPTRPWLLGFFTGFAVLVRPNLAPAAVIVGIWLTVTSAQSAWLASGLLRRNLLAFVLAGMPAAMVLAALNTLLYGSPIGSGYGRAADLFAFAHLLPNAANYGRAVVDTQLGLPFLGLMAPLVLPRESRSIAWLAVGVSLSSVAVYLFYRPFDEWWYLRFLLPALVPLTALAAAVLDHAVQRFPGGDVVRTGVSVVLILALGMFGLQTARDRQAFDLQRLERRFRLAGDIARERLPANAIYLSVWESGSVRHHADRPSLLWDSLDPASLDGAIAWLRARGLDPFIVVEQWEEPLFRARFEGHSPLGALDWPPRYDIDRQVRIYAPPDRDAYLKGEPVRTERILPR